MKLYAHQKRFLDKNLDRALLGWETGTGKTIAACEWLKKRPERKALIIVPKAIVEKWERDIKETGVKNAHIIAMSQVHKVNLDDYEALVIDEAHHWSSPIFTSERSKRVETLYKYVRKNPKAHILLMTATMIRSTPWNIQTLGTFIGQYWDWRQFRKTFFHFTDMFGRWHWEPKKDWRVQIRPYVERISEIVLLSECADIPKQSEEITKIPWTPLDEAGLLSAYMEPSKEWHARHRAEQGRKKFDKIMEIMDGYRKAIVVCNYTEQIDRYVEWIGAERQVFVLDGRTKDQDATIEAAKKSDDCIFIVQASMGAGFDASEFSVVIFASMSFRFVDMIQMRGRVLRVNNLHENLFIFLLAGKNDAAVYNQVKKGLDFHPPHYLK